MKSSGTEKLPPGGGSPVGLSHFEHYNFKDTSTGVLVNASHSICKIYTNRRLLDGAHFTGTLHVWYCVFRLLRKKLHRGSPISPEVEMETV